MMQKKTIAFIKMLSLRGPNIWAYRPVIEAWVDIGDLEDSPSNVIPGFTDRLVAWLPSLIEHRCSIGERGGFIQRLRDGTWPAHILEHIALELQNLAGMPGGLGRARETSRKGVYRVIIRAWHEPVARAALYSARDLVMAAIEDQPFDVAGAISSLREMTDTLRLGPSTNCIVDAADDRDIPCMRLSDANLVQLGYGANQRRIWTAETNHTSAIGESISRDKDLTKTLLQACGLPVPEGRLVDSSDQAWEAAQSIGLPVVVKPLDGNHGRGVFTNLANQDEVAAAYKVAVEEGSGVMVERFVPGNEHRLLVVGDKLIAAARGDAATVTGDGGHTIEQLIELQLNSDPRRGRGEDYPLNFIRLDSAARLELARQGLAADTVIEHGRQALIQRNGNVAIDVTDMVHPSIARAVVLAARIVGLDIAGVDLVVQDISKPLQEQGGAIVEVNAGPGLLMHLKPAQGRPRSVGKAIIDHLFPDGDHGRIPLVGVSGSKGKTTVARLLAHMLMLHGLHTGVACSSGLYFANRHVKKADSANREDGRRVLLNRAVQAGIIESGNRSVLTQGLAYDRCQIGIVTNLDTSETLPDLDVHEPEHLVRVLRTQVDVVLPDGAAILNADSPWVAGMAPLCDGEVIFFSLDGHSSLVLDHVGGGGRAVLIRNDCIVVAAGNDDIELMPVDAIGMTCDGQANLIKSNVLAAVAAAWALGVGIEQIRTAVATFVSCSTTTAFTPLPAQSNA